MDSVTNVSENVSPAANGNTTSLAFDEIASLEDAAHSEVELGKKKRVPRKIIHFVDGDTLEEYSTDEEEEEVVTPPVDPTQLDWMRWFWFWMVLAATKSLAVADFLGEKLAWFFGITAPKYQYIIDEYHKMKEEEEEDERLAREEQEAELAEIETETQGSILSPEEQHIGSDSATIREEE